MSVAATEHHDYPSLHSYGLWLFIASEAFLFGILFAIRFALVGMETPEAVNKGLGLVLTVILLSSSYFAHRAETALDRSNNGGVITNLVVASVLGLLFLGIVAVEWAAGFTEFPASTPYGSVFYLITGTHALHLFIGILVLVPLAVQASRDRLAGENSWRLRGGVRYWHFVDGIWLTVFTVLYLL